MPEVSVRQADFRDVSVFGDGSFDFILATDNVIDALSPDDRLRALAEASRVLRIGGILAFSSHNIQYEKAFSGPQLNWSRNPAQFGVNCVKFVLSLWNHQRVGPMRRVEADYALINDPGHFFACLHYYVAPSTMQIQLKRYGMRLVEIFD